MHSCGTRKTNEENEQTTVSTQKNAIFSSQRFYGLEKDFRERIQLYALKKSHAFHHSASVNKQQRTTPNNNKGEPNYFRLKDKTNQQTTIKTTRGKGSLGHSRCEKDNSSMPNNQMETN